MPDPLPIEAVPSQNIAAGHIPTLDETSAFTPTHGGVPVTPASTADSLIGTTIGRYQLLKKLGDGGMGSVYLAEQSEPVRRQVALKLIRGNFDSRTIIARFEAERQALAVMDHPNIARIYDGGTTSTQHPFFVMELVHGVPITEYCDQHRLSLKQRLELFVPICQAVQHAHQKGIIHRDLKPSNVLVTEVDGRPVPKVIDFGVAKATEQPLTDKSLGDTGAIVGTPTYMSPEQADPESMDIDTRTDIYALGVMLYELLTGSTPIDAKQFRRGALLEVLRMVREVEPPRPSTKLSTAEALPSIAANRNIEPKQLQAMLRGDVDWIVMKALSKERERRYETANGFANDIQRFLNHEPVLAGPASASYRFKKFVKRNKGKVLAASLVLAMLVVGVIGTSVGYYQAERAAEKERLAKEDEARERKRAETNEKLAEDRLQQVEAEKQRTEEERRIAQAVRNFLQYKLLGQADATTQANAFLEQGQIGTEVKENPTIRELLDRASVELEPERIEANFPKQPLLQAELLQTVGSTYRDIGGKENDQYVMAIRFLKRAFDLRKEHSGVDHPDTLISMNHLALAYHASGQLRMAVPLYEKTLHFRKTRLGAGHPYTLNSMNNLAIGYSNTGQLAKAMPLLEETLQLSRDKLGADHPNTFTSMNNLAAGYRATGQLDKALPLYKETLKLRKAKLGLDHPSTVSSLNNLGASYNDAGQYDKALPLFEETLCLKKAKMGVDHPHTLTCMNNLAVAYRAAGQLDKALPLSEETLKLTKAKLGTEHSLTLSSMINLASAYMTAEQFAKALPLLEETFKLTKSKLGVDHPLTLTSMNNLALTYQAVNQLKKALPLLEETFKLTKAKLGANHPDTLNSMGNLGSAYMTAKQFDKALPLFEETHTLTKAKLGPHHPLTLTSLNNLAIGYCHAGQLARALPLLEETLKFTKAKLGENHPDTLQSMNNLGKAYVDAGQGEKAATQLKEYVAASRKRFSKNNSGLAGVLAMVSFDLLKCGQPSTAEEMLRECLAIREKTQPDEWTTFSTQSLLGGALLGQKKYVDAEPLLLKGYEGMKAREKTIPPQGSTRLPEALDRLIQLYTETNKPDEVKKWQVEKAKLTEAKVK